MNILLVSDSYPPEIRSASHLMYELAEELKKRGHSVTVITSWPKYNLEVDGINHPFIEFKDEDGIKVIRLKTLPHHNVNYIVRALAQLIMPIQFLWKIMRHRISVDAVVVYSPPLPLALVGVWLKFRGARFILNVQDLFPQNAIDLGILKNKFQIKFYRTLEQYSYTNSDVVTVHSDGNRKSVLEKFPEINPKLKVLHNWIDLEHHDQCKNVVIDFRKKWELKEKYIAIFAGVIGPSQHLELILDIADSLRDESNLLFLLVGNGVERPRLEKLVTQRRITNVIFKDFISREDYPDLLRICSIGIVCLSPDNKTPVVPGKILGYMAAGLPIAAFLHHASDGHNIIQDSMCGVREYSDDVSACIHAMKYLLSKKNEFSSIGEFGRNYAKSHFSKEVCVSRLEKMILS